jgi:peptide deformylase
MSGPKDNIITLPNIHLRQRSQRIGLVSKEIKQLIDDMISATLDWEDNRKHEVGVALAAVQIDKLYRLVIVREDFEDKKNRNFIVLINPEITKLEGELVEDYEGCLSITDIYGRVKRYSKAKVKALDKNGKPIRITAEGFLARVLQHEIDHTNGIVFIDHIKNNPDAYFKLGQDGQLEPLDYEAEIAGNPLLW